MKSKSMMKKTTLQEIKQSLGRYLAILAIVALGVGFFAGIKLTTPAMVETADHYMKKHALYDYRLLCTLGFDEEIVDEIRQRSDVRVVQGAYSFDVLCQNSSNGNAYVMKAHSITEGVNELHILAGRLPENPNECVVDSARFSERYIGKKLKLAESNGEADLENFEFQEYKIVGVAESPMYINFQRGNTSLGNGEINGFFYLLPEGFDSEAYTEIYVKLTNDYDLYDEDYDSYIEAKNEEWEIFLENLGEVRYENLLVDGREKLEEAKQELKKEKEKAQKKLADAKEELDKAAIDIEDGKKQIAEAKDELQSARETLEKEEKQLENAIRAIAKNEKLLLEKELELEKGIKDWQSGKEQILTSRNQLDQGESLLTGQESQLTSGEKQLAEKEAELIAGEEQFAAIEKLVRNGLAEVEKREAEIETAEQEWVNTTGSVPEYIKLQNDAQREVLKQTKQVLLDSQKELESNRSKLVDGRKQLEEAKEQLKNGRQQLNAAKQQIADGKAQMEAGEKELNSAWTTIKDGRKQIADGRKELLKARQDVEDGKRQIVEAKAELKDGEQELLEKEQELKDGEQEYLDGLKEYEEGLAEFETEIHDAEEKIAQAEVDLAEIESPSTYLLGRDTNVGYRMFQNDSEIVENISTVFPIFFFLVAALVCMTTMSRMIEEQRTQIGTLKALGYGKGTIMGKYLFYSGSAAIIGCLGGYLVGIIVFPYVIWVCYGMMYDMGKLHFVFDWKLACVSLFVAMLCSMGTTWYSCRRELNEVAAQLMRPKTPEAGKRILLERIPFVWNRLKFLQKVSIRNVFRYKKRFFMMVLGISGCTALVLAALGLKDSITNVMNMQYEEIQTFDMGIVLSKVPDEKLQEQLDACLESGMKEYALVMEAAVDINTDTETKSLKLVVPQNMEGFGSYIDMHTQKSEAINHPRKGEGVISHKVAKDLDLDVGDMVELQDDEQQVIRITISGIMQNFVANYIYIHPDTYEEQIGQVPPYKSIYLNVKAETDQNQLAAELMKLDDVATVTVNETERESYEKMMSTLDYIIVLVLVCAAALAFIVIYNLTNINITERVREIATIKVLGFYKKETATYVFRENVLLTLVGSLAGLLLGKILHGFIMDCLKVEMVSFDERISGPSYIYSVILTLAFAVCINKLMEGKLEKISMTESLKSVD